MFNSILIIFITGLIIYFSGERFAKASSEIGDYFNISRSVKGATLDAVASSFPELMIAIFSVVFFKEFGIGVGTIAGSVFFNTLIIPSIAVFASPIIFKVGKEVLSRDLIFYNFSIFAFLSAILYSTNWGIALAVIFIGIYILYIDLIIDQTRRYQTNHKRFVGETISVANEIFIAVLNVLIISLSAYFLTKYAIIFSSAIGIPSIIVGFSVIAMTTSIPDAIIAITNSKKGHTDDVMSNVFGSNIFNIFIGLGVPLFLATILINRSVEVVLGGVELIIGILIATVLINYFVIKDLTITKKNAMVMFLVYIVFLGYLFYIFV